MKTGLGANKSDSLPLLPLPKKRRKRSLVCKPAVATVSTAFANSERNHATLLVIEAIRLHMAEADGHLPHTLADIKIVPVPLNPATGQAFPYRLAADRAELYVPPADGRVPQNGKRVRAAEWKLIWSAVCQHRFSSWRSRFLWIGAPRPT